MKGEEGTDLGTNVIFWGLLGAMSDAITCSACLRGEFIRPGLL